MRREVKDESDGPFVNGSSLVLSHVIFNIMMHL